MVAKSVNTEKVPMFNIFAYTEEKKKVGKIDEILGQIRNVHFSIIPENGVEPSSFAKDTKFFISTQKFSALVKFTNPPPMSGKKGGKGKGKGKGGKDGGKGKGKGKGKGGKKGGKGKK